MIMAYLLLLETVVMSFIWIVSNVGSKHAVFVHCVTKNGILPKLNVFQGMDNWGEFKELSIMITIYN